MIETPGGDAHRTVEAVWRIESAHIVGTLARLTGDVGVAEDLGEGTADYDGGTQRNQPANANPNQNKVGDGGDQNVSGEANWNTDYNRGPDYGSNSPEEREHIET